jgi:hypothetical protein
MFERGICKNTSLETKFSSPFASGNFSSLDWYFLQIPLPNLQIHDFSLSWLGWIKKALKRPKE